MSLLPEPTAFGSAAPQGVALSVMDGFFAATALARDLTFVTRNVRDFAPFGVRLFNPWTE